MQFINAIALITLASFIPTTTTAASPAPFRCVANPKPLSDLPKKFTLSVVLPDHRGRYDSKGSNPVVVQRDGLFSARYGELPFFNQRKTTPTVFSLKNEKLLVKDSEAALLNIFASPSLTGLLEFAWNTDLAKTPLNFTATRACDSYGKSFLRLGGNDGELVVKKEVFGIKYFFFKGGFFY